MNTTNNFEDNALHTPPYDPVLPPVVRDDYPVDDFPVTATPTQTLPANHASMPGRQIGLYCNADARDVKQMVRMINNPEDEGQDSRG